MKDTLSVTLVLLAMVLWCSLPAASRPLDTQASPTTGGDTQRQGVIWEDRVWQAPIRLSNTPSTQTDLRDFALGGTSSLDALTDQLQNLLKPRPPGNTLSESVAEPVVRNSLDQISTIDAPRTQQSDTNALAENLEDALNRQLLVGAGNQPMARTQLWSSIRNALEDIFAPKCSDALYIMAYTSGNKYAFTRDTPIVELQVGDESKGIVLPDIPGETFIANKGDMWRINLSDFGFANTCITKGDVEITLVATGNDGWHIDSIVTFLRAEDSFTLLSSDMDVNRWVDGNQGQEFKRFSLSTV